MQYRFYNFTLDTGQWYLTTDGVPVEADARQLQLLRLLIDAYPEPCSQQQLLDALWPNTVVSHWSAVPLVIGEAPDVRGRILWVDDNPDNNLSERRHFESRDIAVYIATNTDDALTLLSMYRYHAVISDMGRGDEPLAGFKLMEHMRAHRDDTPYFLYTIMPSESQRDLVRLRGGNGVAVSSKELYSMVLPMFERENGVLAPR